MKRITSQREFFLSQTLGKPIYDRNGKLVGRLRDMAVRWDNHYPRVTGIKFAKDVQKHIGISQIEQWDERGIRLNVAFTDELQLLTEEELYVGKWLLDKQIIDTKGSKLVRVNDIMMAWIASGPTHDLILVAVDVGVRGLLRRIGVEILVRGWPQNLVDWKYIKPPESKMDNLRLTLEHPSLKDLHPADLADIIEDMDSVSRTQLLAGLDRQTAIEALTEADLDTQVEIITDMDSTSASEMLADMPPDEAADILGELPEEKSSELLNLMDKDEAEDVRDLMEYEENTAGALMTTEFISFPADTTTEDCINRLRELAPSAKTIYYLYIIDHAEVLRGVVSLRDLIVAQPHTELGAIMRSRVVTVRGDDNIKRVQETVAKYDLLALPVVDEQGVLLGIITVDDVMETVFPDRGGLESFTDFMTHSKSWRMWKP
jgi:CBS domain-containing protein/sporulation protein YlmC with PRC-barrel domain